MTPSLTRKRVQTSDNISSLSIPSVVNHLQLGGIDTMRLICFGSSLANTTSSDPSRFKCRITINHLEFPRTKSLSDVVRLVEEAAAASLDVKVCRFQSSYLAKVFKQAGQCIQQWRSILHGCNHCELAVQELASSMDKGVRLLQSCQEQAWAFRALLHEENQSEFSQVIGDILESLRLLSLVLVNLAEVGYRPTIAVVQRDFLGQLRDPDGAIADAAAKDRLNLWEMVEGSQDKCKVHEVLRRKCAESRSGVQENLFIDFKQLELKRLLSSGAYGVVHEATWLDYPVAVKVFRRGDTTFSRELAALIPLKHPNIVRVLGYSYQDETGRCALVMERMCMDLGKFLKSMRSRICLLDSISIMLEIATAMRLLHSENIIHRDLKPANILVNTGTSLRFKVADFGFARTKFVTNDVTHATCKVGTRSFRAPEVYESEKYSKKADVYSFAMVSYQILTGEMPFLGILKHPEFNDMVCQGCRPDLPPSCPQQLSRLLKLCWSGRPEERPDFWHICDMLKLLKGCLVTKCSWDEVKDYELANKSPGLSFFDGGGYNVGSLKKVGRVLGHGTTGMTYQAEVGNDLVAVKRLQEPKASLTSKQQFRMLGSLNHRNVLPLRSYYCAERECLLVYNFLPGPNLGEAFHGCSGARLDWSSRMQIALSVAKGLAYLHSQPSLNGNGGGFVHGSLHFSNVILDGNDAVITDAGVSYIVRQGAELSQSSDTYGFGVIVMELLTRKAPGLVRYLLQHKRTTEVFDEELLDFWPTVSKEVTQMLRIALACVSASPPKMERVAVLIEKLGAIRDDALPPGSSLPA